LIEERYNSIPFESLRGNDIYYPLFLVNSILPSLRLAAEECVQGEKDENQITRLKLAASTIQTLGEIYRKKLNDTCKEINEREGNNDFEIRIPPGITGQVFPPTNGVG